MTNATDGDDGRLEDIPPLSFGEWLRRVRRTRRDTQKAVALQFGVSQPSFYRWESGDSSPSPRHIEMLAQYLGSDVATVFRAIYTNDVSSPPRNE